MLYFLMFGKLSLVNFSSFSLSTCKVHFVKFLHHSFRKVRIEDPSGNSNWDWEVVQI